MLLRNKNKGCPSPSFNRDLAQIKHAYRSQQVVNKHMEYYKAMNSVLDLLLKSYPSLTAQLLTLKQALSKWFQYLKDDLLARNRQKMTMGEEMIVHVSKNIGIVLQEIGYYLKCLLEMYQDDDIRIYYTKFLISIKKLDWGWDYNPNVQQTTSKQTQTQQQQNVIETSQSISRVCMKSEDTIDSPLRKYKQVDIHKYIKIKQENLDFQRRNDRLQSRVEELEAENKALKKEIQRLLAQNISFKENNLRELKQIAKLKDLLKELHNQQSLKQKRQQQKRLNYTFAQNKYSHLNYIKTALHESLDNAEQQFTKQRKQQLAKQRQQIQYFEDNFKVNNDDQEDSKYKTIKKTSKNIESSPEYDQYYRILLTQASALQTYLQDSSLQLSN